MKREMPSPKDLEEGAGNRPLTSAALLFQLCLQISPEHLDQISRAFPETVFLAKVYLDKPPSTGDGKVDFEALWKMGEKFTNPKERVHGGRAYCNSPSMSWEMPFGKYKGVRLKDVPANYLWWVAFQMDAEKGSWLHARACEIRDYYEANASDLDAQRIRETEGTR